ncbi:MAG: hypothetical protein JO110_28250 [Acetobacteraceae bacterium]|nr:hypothetical protein [Acetobacteraceae bacterium]
MRRDKSEEIACEGRVELACRVEVERLNSVQAAVDCIIAAASAGQAVAWVRNAVDDAIESRELLAAREMDPAGLSRNARSIPGLPPPRPIPVKDRSSILFLEKGQLDVIDGAFVVIDIKLPFGSSAE